MSWGFNKSGEVNETGDTILGIFGATILTGC